MTEFIAEIWRTGVIPPEWKKAVTILIYKKGDTCQP